MAGRIIALLVARHLLHLALQFLSIAAKHLLLPALLIEVLFAGALLLRKFFLAASQCLEFLKRLVDFLLALGRRAGVLSGLVLVLLGVELEIREGVGPVIERPVRTADDVAHLRAFDAEASAGPLLEAIRLVRAESPVPLIGFAGAPFTLACYLVEGGPARDFVRTKTLLHAEPVAWAALMDRLTDMTIAYLRAQVAAGVQAVQLFDSWVGGLSPLDYERAVLPTMRRLFAGIADLGVPVIHFGVGTAGILPLQAAAGGDVIGLDWRIELADGWRRVGDRGVQGNLDPTLLLGPWEATAEAARWVLGQAAGRPGHVFNLGHGVLPGTDPDDLARLVDLVHAYRSAGPGDEAAADLGSVAMGASR